MEQKALFVGFKSFKSKAGKQLYLLQFLVTSQTLNGEIESSLVSVFTDQATYNSYISHDIMTESLLSVRINGTNVYYDVVA